MKSFLITILLMFSISLFSQQKVEGIDMKDTIKYWLYDADSIVGSYSTNKSNALEKFSNYRALHPNADLKIVPKGEITGAKKMLTTTRVAPIVDSVSVDNGVYVLYIKEDPENKPISYGITVNDTLRYIGLKYEKELLIAVDSINSPDIRVIPIYKTIDNSLKSNKINIEQ